MELHQLRYFAALAEAGSMTLAARRSRVSQPSLSQAIRTLENTLGVRLVDRLGTGVALTEAGRSLLPHAQRVLAEIERAREQARGPLGGAAVRLAIGAIPTMAPYLLPGVLAGIRRAHPACELIVEELTTQRLIERVVESEIDVAITSTPIVHEHLEVQVIGREPLLVALPPSHPLAGGGRVGLADLREQSTVSLDEMHCLAGQVSAFCARARLSPAVVCRSTQLATLLSMVSLGLGISMVPAMAAASGVASGTGGRVSFVRLRGPGPWREVAVIRRRGRTMPRAALDVPALVEGELHALTARAGTTLRPRARLAPGRSSSDTPTSTARSGARR